MSTNLAADLTVTGSDQLIVIGVAVIALVALAVAFVLRASVDDEERRAQGDRATR